MPLSCKFAIKGQSFNVSQANAWTSASRQKPLPKLKHICHEGEENN
ncbi:uncharacterized protein G2W53_024517 [Senna tora]|uniref:Uncharacterized protein n=1 Tax=Senna tora TaxID=362788 RepID=A0A834TDN6_9FABA|nr:uncharacterized protein G2W53_024517 [Senna tora]